MTLDELIAKAKAVIDAYDHANDVEKYDECKWDTFVGTGNIEDLRELLAKHTPAQPEPPK